MKFRLYMDESGDHGLTTVDPDFPVFLLCGVIMTEKHYDDLSDDMNRLKEAIWNSKEVIFHSRDIRKCEKEFVKLFDLRLKERFYGEINRIMAEHRYAIIASGIRKDRYIRQIGRLSNDVYELALSFIIERAVFLMDDVRASSKSLEIVIERRGGREDKLLEEHFQRLMSRGTGYVSAERLKAYDLRITFRSKRENINGLQLADLIAYPMARHLIAPERPNPAFDVLAPKIYTKRGRRYGLKVYPK